MAQPAAPARLEASGHAPDDAIEHLPFGSGQTIALRREAPLVPVGTQLSRLLSLPPPTRVTN